VRRSKVTAGKLQVTSINPKNEYTGAKSVIHYENPGSSMGSSSARKARIDMSGALHHLMIRGIERNKIFRDDQDRDNFLDRLGKILVETKTPCYVWALLPNHVHLLLRTGRSPLATVMGRLLTGYAVTFNHKYKRHGQLFQNRYKSILFQEDPYLLELVRYIHMNPLRAKVVLDYSGKYARMVPARSVFCYWAVRELGMRETEIAQRLKVTQPAVSISVRRGEQIAKEKRLVILGE
jgi:REP element-mobilizing transposase RayT